MAESTLAREMPRAARLAATQQSWIRWTTRDPRHARSLSTTASLSQPAVDRHPAAARLTHFPTSPQPEPRVSRREALQKAKPFSEFLTDNFNRQHDYLRISITERCNLRCVYCMPAEGVALSPPSHLLTTPEIFYLTSLFVSQGVTKIRLTGGEPTVRKDIIPLMQQIGSLRSKGLREIALTTNGLLLHRKLDAMVEAGLTGVNMSLDTLDPFQFQIMTRRKGFDVVMRGIDTILEMNRMGAGIKLKINCVVMRGVNEREILPFVEMGTEKDIEVRFIEYMPFGGNKWSQRKMLSYQEMLDIIRTKYPSVHRVQGHKSDTSKTFKVPGFVGRIGFITSMTEDFCGSCNRLRITGDGNLKVCLHGNTEVSLRDMLREGNEGKPIDEEAFENIKQLEIDKHQGLLPEGTALGWGEREQSLLNLIGTAVKRKKEKHAGMGKLENMENRPMILIDKPRPGTSTETRSPVWATQLRRLALPIATTMSWPVLPGHLLCVPIRRLASFSNARAFSTDTSVSKPETREKMSLMESHHAHFLKHDWKKSGFQDHPDHHIDSEPKRSFSGYAPGAFTSTIGKPRWEGRFENQIGGRDSFAEQTLFRSGNPRASRAPTSRPSLRLYESATLGHQKSSIRRGKSRSKDRTSAPEHEYWALLSSRAFTAPKHRPRSLKAWEWQVHHLGNRVNTVSATIARIALPLTRKEIWRICKGLTHQELHELEARGVVKSVARSQVEEAVAEMVHQRKKITEHTGKDPAMIFSSMEPKSTRATADSEPDEPGPQRPKPVLGKDRTYPREYEDPFHLSKMLLNRAAKERIEKASKGVYKGSQRLIEEFEPSLMSWRREVYAIAQTISERFEERKNGVRTPERYRSTCGEVSARVQHKNVGITQLEQIVQAAKIAKKAYLNSPAQGRAQRAALQAVEARQSPVVRRAQAMMAAEKTIDSVLKYKLPDWRAEVDAIHQSLTGVSLEKGTVHIRFGLQGSMYVAVPVSRDRLMSKVWAMERDLNRLLKHEIPSWRAAIGLNPYKPAEGLPDQRATHMHFRPQNPLPADAKLPDRDGVNDTIGTTRERIRLHAVVFIQTAIRLVEAEFAIWSREVLAIERRRKRRKTKSPLYVLANVYPRQTASHASGKENHESVYMLEAYKRRFKAKLTLSFGPGQYPELDQLRTKDVADITERNLAFRRMYELAKRRKLQFLADGNKERTHTELRGTEAQRWEKGVATLLSQHQMVPAPQIQGVTSDLIADALRRGESRTSLMRTLLDMVVLQRRVANDGHTSDAEHDFADRFQKASVMRWRQDFKNAMRRKHGFGRDFSVIDQLDYETLCCPQQRRFLFWTLSDMTRKKQACNKIYNVKTDELAKSGMERWKSAAKLHLRTRFGPGEYSEVDDVTTDTFRREHQRSEFLLQLYRKFLQRQNNKDTFDALPREQLDRDRGNHPKIKPSRSKRQRLQQARSTNFVIKVETLSIENETPDPKQAVIEAEMESKQREIVQQLREAAVTVATEQADHEVLKKQIAIETMQAQYRGRESELNNMKAERVGRQTIDKLRSLQLSRLTRHTQSRSAAMTTEGEAPRSGPLISDHQVEETDAKMETMSSSVHKSDTIEPTSSLTDPSLAKTKTVVSLADERERAMVRLRELLLRQGHAAEVRKVFEMAVPTLTSLKEQYDANFTVTVQSFKPTKRKWAPLRQTINPDEPASSGTTEQPKVEAQPQHQQSHGHLTHLTASGTAHMVDVTLKAATHRLAVAIGTVSFSDPATLGLVRSAALKKGDVLGVARIAGIQAAKLCSTIIPLCHPIFISRVEVNLTVLDAIPPRQDKQEYLPVHASLGPLEHGGIQVEASVDCLGPTGVEMEALTATMGACLTVVDMVKAVDRGASIADVRVVRKMGGRSGEWVDKRYIDR